MRVQSTKLLQGMAERLRNDPDFMAKTLRLYKQQEDCDDEEVARELETSQSILLRLALCKRPDSTAQIDAQVQQLSDYTGIEATTLSRLIKQVEEFTTLPESEGRPTQKWLAFIRSAIRWLVIMMSYHALLILTNVCLIALISVSVSWWQGDKNRFQEASPISLQTSKRNVLTARTKENTSSVNLLSESATVQLSSASNAITQNPLRHVPI
jgi:hypothetical protein